MPKKMFVNLPVTNLARSVAFYQAVGGTVFPRFTDHTAACLVLSDVLHIMLLTHDKWRQFTSRTIPDAHASAQVFLCVSEDSRSAVDAVMDKVAAAGGTVDPNPSADHGFMYHRSYADPDGHIWEVMWMDEAGLPSGAEAGAA